MGHGAGLGHVHSIAPHLQTGGDDVVERDQHGDLAVECDPQHAVEVPIGDQEAATVGLQRVLESGRDDERSGRRIGQVELANVSHDRETVWAVHSVDTVNVAAADVRADEGDQRVRDVVDERDVDRPTDDRPPMLMIAVGRPLANVVTSPVSGSTREILPTAPSVTYSAPSGPTVLPLALSRPVSRPVTSRVAVGGPGHGDEALAADDVIIA